MKPSLTRTRRRSTAALGIYVSAALGAAGSLVVFRVLGPTDAGRFAVVMGAVTFFELLLELTSDEALVKYGFRYAAREDWGRFHRLVQVTFSLELVAGVAAGVMVAALAPVADHVFNGRTGLAVPFLVAAALPPLHSIESMGAATFVLRSRYDVRGAFLALSMALRLAGLAIGTQFGVTGAILGLLVAQALVTAAIVGAGLAALRRFPAAPAVPLGDDRRPVLRFVTQSSIDTSLLALRAWIAPLTLGVVRTTTDVGLFRAAQSPETGFALLSSPVRLILLTEQTRDWEEGRPDVVLRSLRRYVIGATLLMAAILPPSIWAMPWLVRNILGHRYLPATDAARFVAAAAAIQLIFGWTKSFPVTIGRPGLRIVAHAIETAVLLPLIVVFGDTWGVTGAGAAVLIAACAFALTWTVLVVRLRLGSVPTAGSATEG